MLPTISTPQITAPIQTQNSEPFSIKVLNVLFQVEQFPPVPSNDLVKELANNLKSHLEQASTKTGVTVLGENRWHLYHTQELVLDVESWKILNFYPAQVDPEDPEHFNYRQFVQDENLCNLIKGYEYDEVWIWANHTGRLYESKMVGPSGKTFTVNTGPLLIEQCERPFFIMGFNTETPVENALHSYAHRMEYLMYKALDDKEDIVVYPTAPGDLTFSFFSNNLYAGIANRDGFRSCGNVHYPPNNNYTPSNNISSLEADHIDWQNHESIKSDCYYWSASNSATILDFNNSNLLHDLSCLDWQCTQLGYMNWWLNQLPNACSSQDIRHNGKVKNIWAFAFGKTEPRTCNFRKLCNPEGFTNGLKLGDDVNYCRSDIGIGAPPILFPETPIDGIEQQKLECIAINGKAHWACIDTQ